MSAKVLLVDLKNPNVFVGFIKKINARTKKIIPKAAPKSWATSSKKSSCSSPNSSAKENPAISIFSKSSLSSSNSLFNSFSSLGWTSKAPSNPYSPWIIAELMVIIPNPAVAVTASSSYELDKSADANCWNSGGICADVAL